MTSPTISPAAARTTSTDAGLAIDFIDGDHVTLIARLPLGSATAVAHRLGGLIASGVTHFSLDVRFVDQIHAPVAACLNDIALGLSERGGVLELLHAQPDVVATFAATDDDLHRDHHRALQ